MSGSVADPPPVFVKCACSSCQCRIDPAKGIERDGKLYCSRACAYDCTETTCVCVHERCDAEDEPAKPSE